MTVQKQISAPFSGLRFHVRGIPKKWTEDGLEEASWRLFEAVADQVLIDNASVLESKQLAGSYFGILDLARPVDADRLLAALNDRDRFQLPGDKCYLTIRKFHEPRPRSARRLVYGRDEILALRDKADRPPRIPTSVFALIKRVYHNQQTAAKDGAPTRK